MQDRSQSPGGFKDQRLFNMLITNIMNRYRVGMIYLFNFFVIDDTLCKISICLTMSQLLYAMLFDINYNYMYRFVLQIMFFRLIIQRLVYTGHGLSEKKYIIFPLVFLSLMGTEYEMIKIPFSDMFLIFSYIVIWIDSIVYSFLKRYDTMVISPGNNKYYEQLNMYTKSIYSTNLYMLLCVLVTFLHFQIVQEKK
jgi:hypothetical protein